MQTLLYIVLIAAVFVITFYFVYEAGYTDGKNDTFKAYMLEWVEIRQRVSDETWNNLVRAYTIMDERKKKLAARSKK
jgi:hypothetical protein